MPSILAKLNMSSLSAQNNGLLYRGMNPAGLAKAGVPAAVILTTVQQWLEDQVDVAAERLRGQVLTPGAGQAMEYQEAVAEATAALAAPTTATAALYPMLASSIGIDIDPSTKAPATDVVGVARAVQAMQSAWVTAGAAIRQARLAGKAAIASSTTIAAAVAAYDAIVWPAV